MSISVAVVGATGLIGEALLSFLAEGALATREVHALASYTSAGKRVDFGEGRLKVGSLTDFDFSRVQLVFFCVPDGVASEWVPKVLAAGCTVIDWSASQPPETAAYVAAVSPLVYPLATVLKPLVARAGIARLDVSAALAVSEKGRAGVNELAAQTARLLNVQDFKPAVFPAQIAFNVLQAGDTEKDAGQLANLLDAGDAPVQISAMIVPVFFGHSSQVLLQTVRPLSAHEATALLTGIPRVEFADAEDGPVSAVTHAANQDEIILGPILDHGSLPNTLMLSVVGDNIRSGAALNGIQLAEILVKDLQ